MFKIIRKETILTIIRQNHLFSDYLKLFLFISKSVWKMKTEKLNIWINDFRL